jgi:hypothetical protein
MFFVVSPPNRLRSMKLGLRAPRRPRDEFADLDRLDRPELDEDEDGAVTPESEPPTQRKVA